MSDVGYSRPQRMARLIDPGMSAAMTPQGMMIDNAVQAAQQPAPRAKLASMVDQSMGKVLDDGSFDRQFQGNRAKGEHQPKTDVGLLGMTAGNIGAGVQNAAGLDSNPLDADGNRRKTTTGDAVHNTVTGLASMPGELWRSADRLHQATTGYGMTGTPRAANPPRDPELGDYAPMQDALNVAGALPVGGLLSAGARSGQSVGIFGGQLSKTADLAALERAKAAKTAGVPREKVWSDHGWFEGVDGKWRHEIDDGKAKLLDPTIIGDRFLPANEAMTHKKLFDSYPELGSADVYSRRESGGSFNKVDGEDAGALMIGRYASNPTGVALHEFQHGVQGIEGFAKGGNVVNDPTYKRLAGETEARTVEARQNLTADERRARPPWLDYDVPESQQIVRNSGNGPQMSVGDVVPFPSRRIPDGYKKPDARDVEHPLMDALKNPNASHADVDAASLPLWDKLSSYGYEPYRDWMWQEPTPLEYGQGLLNFHRAQRDLDARGVTRTKPEYGVSIGKGHPEDSPILIDDYGDKSIHLNPLTPPADITKYLLENKLFSNPSSAAPMAGLTQPQDYFASDDPVKAALMARRIIQQQSAHQ